MSRHREQQKRLQKLAKFIQSQKMIYQSFLNDFRQKIASLEKKGEQMPQSPLRKKCVSEEKNSNETLKVRLQVTEYAPRLFKRLRNLDGIDNEDIINSLDVV